MRIGFRLAERGDDAALRRLLAETPMPGKVTVTFEREPDYFVGMRMMGRPWQAIVAEEEESGEIVGMLCRALQERFVNGEPRPIGYWGQLRVARGYQGRVLLHGALEFAERLQDETPADAHFAVIAEGNGSALRLFGGRHAGALPDFKPLAKLVTLGMLLRRPRGSRTGYGDFEILDGERAGMDAVVRFLREAGRGKQLFPVYDEAYFRDCRIAPSDILVASKAGAIQGVAGIWDQSACKQTVVRAYGGIIAPLRPLFNAAAPLLGLAPLPGPGEKMKAAYLSFVATRDNAAAPFDVLLREACHRAALRGFAELMLGFCEGDPLLERARRCLHVSYTARLSIVEAHGPKGATFASSLDGRIPYVEIAAL